MLRAVLNKSWQQHPTSHQLYSHLPPIMKTIQVRRTRHAGHSWRSRDDLISDVLLWTPTYGRAKAERPARTYIQHLCEDIGRSPENLPEAIGRCGERGSQISVLAARHDDDDDDDDSLGIMQEIQVWPNYQMAYAQTRITSEKWDAHNSLRFWDANRSSHPDHTTRPNASFQQMRTCRIKNFAVPTDHGAKLNENKKRQILGPWQKAKIS